MENLQIQFANNIDTNKILQSVSKDGLISLIFKDTGVYFIQGYRVNEQTFSPMILNGPAVFHVEQESCHDYSLNGQS